MEIKMMSFLLAFILLVSSFLAGANSINIKDDTKSSSFLSQADLPEWNIGNLWQYNMDFDFRTNEGGSTTFSVAAEITGMIATLTDIIVIDNKEFYHLTIADGIIDGVVSLFETEWEVADFEGELEGYALICKDNLAIKEFNFMVDDGRANIPLLGWKRLDFTMTMNFDPDFDFFDFPIVEGEEDWDVVIEEATLHAEVDIDVIFGQHEYDGSMAFTDVMGLDRLETISVGAGNFDCFVIGGTWGYESELWYAPDVGYFAKVDEALDWEDSSIEAEYHLELIYTNYNQNNNPPNKPDKPTGQTTGEVEMDYTYTTQTTDPDADKIYYWFDWGDGTNSGWVGPYPSGVPGSASHRWYETGVYSVVAKAKDESGIESCWSEPLSVMIMGRPKVTILMHYLERKDEIDYWILPNSEEPEWYYMCHAKTEEGSPPQYNEHKDEYGEWISSYSWTPDEEHEFEVTDRNALILIKLMDYDGIWEGGNDDLADVSGCNYPDDEGVDDGTPDKRGAIYHGTYDLVTEDLKYYSPDPDENADYVYKESGYYITAGDHQPDNSTEWEGGEFDGENDAVVWFRLTNDYNNPQANAQLLEPIEKRRPYEPLTFIGTVRYGAPDYSWHWEFSDGTTSNEQNPIKTFDNKGTYTAELTVTDGFGQTSKHTIQFTLINDNPVLTNDKVKWTGDGTASDIFTFTVHYFDPNQDSPTVKKVYLDGSPKNLNGQGTNSDYTLNLKGSEIGKGNHKFYFEFDDGHGGKSTTSEKSFAVKKCRSRSMERFTFLFDIFDRFPFLLRLFNFG